MTSVYMMVFWIFLRASSCQHQCEKETLDDREFSINVDTHVEVEATECIRIPFQMTFPRNKVTVPFKIIMFNIGGDPSNFAEENVVHTEDSDTTGTFWMDDLPRGEYEYSFKLEFGCNQTYIFPQRVHISVSASNRKPHIQLPLMKEEQDCTVFCLTHFACSGTERIFWKWTKNDGQTVLYDGHDEYHSWHRRYRNIFKLVRNTHYHKARLDDYPMRHRRKRNFLKLIPTADHHNTNMTCVAEYDHDVIETSVTLNVKFSPKILNDSRCVVEGELLVCVCVSWGNPLPPIIWPLEILTDYSVSSFSTAQTVHSTITLSAAGYQNTTLKCISTNELGQTETEIPLQNSTGDPRQNHGWKGFHEALPWIAAVCFSLNLVFITGLIIRIWRRWKRKQKMRHEEINTYETLRKTDVEQEYSVISLQPI